MQGAERGGESFHPLSHPRFISCRTFFSFFVLCHRGKIPQRKRNNIQTFSPWRGI